MSAFHSVEIPEGPAVRQFLSKNNWPEGLQDTFLRGIVHYPVRYILVDDSTSMGEKDTYRLVGDSTKSVVECTRWEDLKDSLQFVADLAEVADAKTVFRFLNKGDTITVGVKEPKNLVELKSALEGQQLFDGTPLCKHIKEVAYEIKSMKWELEKNKQKAVVVITTDGISSDGDVKEALKLLEGLPVWVVYKLCTEVIIPVSYWHNVAKSINVECDVLDCLHAEAMEIQEFNQWLVYGIPLQHLREFGIFHPELDHLDDHSVDKDHMRIALSAILGGDIADYPDPETNWDAFKSLVQSKLAKTSNVWDPRRCKMKPWVSLNKLGQIYGDQKAANCSIM